MMNLLHIHNMIQLQDELNSFVNPDWRHAGNDWGLAIMAECTELADHVGWKWWKDQPMAPLTQIHLECVDIWHFLLSAVMEQKAEEKLVKAILSTNHVGSVYGTVERSSALSAARKLSMHASANVPMDEQLCSFIILLYSVRLSFDDLYQLYAAKAALNLFRWKNGYKEGSYIKTWEGVEDNVVLEGILKDYPDISRDGIDHLLQARYASVLLSQEAAA